MAKIRYTKIEINLQEQINKLGDKSSEEVRQKTSNNSPIRTGKYKDSWSVDVSGSSVKRYKIYNKEYRLTHLLEFGHATRNGGRTAPMPHLAPAFNQEKINYLTELKSIKLNIKTKTEEV